MDNPIEKFLDMLGKSRGWKHVSDPTPIGQAVVKELQLMSEESYGEEEFTVIVIGRTSHNEVALWAMGVTQGHVNRTLGISTDF